MPKVSIVIPVYNVEEYLKQCLNSVVSQTFTDWECIVIDDGSTDLSWKICDNFAKTDKRFTVIHQKNQGVSKARNVGIEKAQGEFIAFIDPDDYINDDYLSALINEQKRTGVDIVDASIIFELDKGLKINTLVRSAVKSILANHSPQINRKYLLCSKSEISNVIVELRSVCWGWLFKSQIWRKLRFPEEVYTGEDLLFVLEVLSNAESICKSDKAIYYYRARSNGLTRKIISYDEYKRTIASWQKSIKHIAKNCPNAQQALNKLYMWYSFQFQRRIKGFGHINWSLLFLPLDTKSDETTESEERK